jgi:DNA-binding NarL/FixJ family response regulator
MPQHQGFGSVLEAPRPNDGMARLTVQERNVLELLAEGHSNDGIAERLAVTARTVETHTSRIFTKLGLEANRGTHRRVLAVLAHLGVSGPMDGYGAANW